MKTVSIHIEGEETLSDPDKLAILEKEVDDFDSWMQKLQDWKYQGPLTKPERVLLLTYLMQKHSGHIDKR